MRSAKACALAALLALQLSGCGDGEPTSGVPITAVSYGAVTDLGSVFVNGVEFSTVGAAILRDDVAIAESELRRGIVVEVRGSLDTSISGVAASVFLEQAVRGPVQSVAGTAAAGTLQVLGQTVRVDERTLYDSNVPDFSSIATGMLLEVHGETLASGVIAARFVQRKTVPIIFSVRGTVAGHNGTSRTFMVGALTVDYSVPGTAIGDMPAPGTSNWNGLFVAVRGNSCQSALPACGTLTASKVAPEALGLTDALQAEAEGFVTLIASASSFNVGTQAVATNASTLFLGGDASEIALNARLEVEGSLSGGVLTAIKVRFNDSVTVESNATASGAVITALDGLPGIVVTANSFTEFRHTLGATATNLGPLNGRYVRIRGRASGAGTVIASVIEDVKAADPNDDVRLQGLATSTASTAFQILGVTADTSLLAAADFLGTNNAAIGSTAFYNALAPNGALVRARGRLPAANALAAGPLGQVELEQ